MFIRIILFFLLYSNVVFCGSCNFNLPYNGLSCSLDLSHKNLNNIKKLLNKEDKFAALTFDDGPSSRRVNDILNVLKKHKSKATFFVLGERINKKTSEIVKEIHKAGHEIGNHLNMYSILWTVDSLDWQSDKPEILVERIASNLHNGAIMLFHDHDSRSNTAQALPNIIRMLKKSGYKLVTLSEWEKRVCDAVKAKNMLNRE